MAKKLITLDESDVEVLREMVALHRKRYQNPRQRPGPTPSDSPAPDVYIIRTPLGGIPAMEEQVGTSTGSGDMPGSASCRVYRLTSTGFLQYAGFSRTVYNLAPAAVPGEHLSPVVRDKWGTWVLDRENAVCAAITVYESDLRCEEGNLNLYTRPITLSFVDGCLVRTPQAYQFVKTVACCDDTCIPDTGTTGCCGPTSLCGIVLGGALDGLAFDLFEVDPPPGSDMAWAGERLDLDFGAEIIDVYATLVCTNGLYGMAIDIYFDDVYSSTVVFIVSFGSCSPFSATASTINPHPYGGTWTLSEGPCGVTPGTATSTSTGTGGGGGATGLVMWLKLNEGTGTTAFDYSGNGNHHTILGSGYAWSADTPGSQAGSGGSLSLTSANTQGGVTGLPIGNSARTVSFWAKVDSSAAKFVYGDSDFDLYSRDDASVRVFDAQSGANADASANAPNLAWFLYTFVYTGNADWLYYENGVFDVTGAFAGLSTGAGGVSTLGPAVNPFLIKDLRVYDRALTAGEVAALYDGSFGP